MLADPRRSTRRWHGALSGALGLVVVALMAGCAGGVPGGPGSTSSGSPSPSDTVRDEGLVWSAEFDEARGAPLNPAEWDVSTRGDGYGNAEVQVYTARPENVLQDGDGALRLIARAERFTDPAGTSRDYTSGRVETRTHFQYGRVEARIKLPSGAGLWPAFWLFGESLRGEEWPAVGEIDILEQTGESIDIHQTVIGATAGGQRWSRTAAANTGVPWSDDWHVYAVQWDEARIAFSIDGQESFVLARTELVDDEEWPFDRPYSITLNLAVGGWGGDPLGGAFPAEMLVDYVRVYDSKVVRP